MRITASICIGLLASASAQDTIIAERPGFSTSPQALDQGKFQIETGFQWDLRPELGTAPQFLGRYGVGSDTELQLNWSGVSAGNGETAVSGVGFSVKHALASGDGARPAIGIIGSVSVPSGDEASTDTDVSAGLLWSNTLGGGFGLFGTLTGGFTSPGGERVAGASNALGLSYSAGRGHGFFIEHFVQLTEGMDDEVQYVDSGYTYLVHDNMQIDLTGGISVGAAEATSFISAGLAVRY